MEENSIYFWRIKDLEKIKEFFLNALNKKDIKNNLEKIKVLLEINIEILYENQIISVELFQKDLNKDELILQLLKIINNMKNEKYKKMLIYLRK